MKPVMWCNKLMQRPGVGGCLSGLVGALATAGLLLFVLAFSEIIIKDLAQLFQ